MAKRGLNNFRRKPFFRNGKESWALESLDGTPVDAFDAYCEKISNLSHQTQKRYAEVVSRFIDYLYEAKAFDNAVRPSHLNKVIEAYPTLISDGSRITSARVRGSCHDLWLADAAERLNWDPLKSTSLDNTLAAVNGFLRLSEGLARDAKEKADYHGIDSSQPSGTLITSIAGTKSVGSWEVAAIRQASMFGSVAKFASEGVHRAKGIQASSKSPSQERDLDYPRQYLAPLIQNATSWRDKCLWLLISALGLRSSEALNLQVKDVDLVAQKVYIFDPSGRRALMEITDPKRLRFKGREMVYTFPIPDLVKDLFYAIEQYLKQEFVPYRKQGEPNYLLQYIDSQHRGRPYVDASHTALLSNFKKAVAAAKVPLSIHEKNWGLHSLRHMYGVYMVNDYPVDPNRNLFGLDVNKVQMMMGHTNISSTAHYARIKRYRL
jgi:integrase